DDLPEAVGRDHAERHEQERAEQGDRRDEPQVLAEHGHTGRADPARNRARSARLDAHPNTSLKASVTAWSFVAGPHRVIFIASSGLLYSDLSASSLWPWLTS